MRLPKLPKIIEQDPFVFYRMRRHENQTECVEYKTFKYGLFVGLVYLHFDGTADYQAMGGPKSVLKEFRAAYAKWEKENLFRKQMRDIVNDI